LLEIRWREFVELLPNTLQADPSDRTIPARLTAARTA
jgi:hypothetical protein